MDVTSPQLTREPESEIQEETSGQTPSTSSSQMPTDPKKGIDIFKVIIVILGILISICVILFIYSLLF